MQEKKEVFRGKYCQANSACPALSNLPSVPNSAFDVIVIIVLFSIYVGILETRICPTEITL